VARKDARERAPEETKRRCPNVELIIFSAALPYEPYVGVAALTRHKTFIMARHVKFIFEIRKVPGSAAPLLGQYPGCRLSNNRKSLRILLLAFVKSIFPGVYHFSPPYSLPRQRD
jgi:hypothetical protein